MGRGEEWPDTVRLAATPRLPLDEDEALDPLDRAAAPLPRVRDVDWGGRRALPHPDAAYLGAPGADGSRELVPFLECVA